MLLVTLTPIDYWWATALAGKWQAPRGEVLVVLGGSLQDYGTVGGSSYWRGVYALQAWREGGFQQVVISGGGSGENTVAKAIAGFLASQGVPREAILLEEKSQSTRENALHTAELLAGEKRRVVLLTSDYHMLRARRAFERAGLLVEPRPYPDVRKRETQWLGRWPAFLDLCNESAKVLYYLFRGWI